jgi:hypothetical protein
MCVDADRLMGVTNTNPDIDRPKMLQVEECIVIGLVDPLSNPTARPYLTNKFTKVLRN